MLLTGYMTAILILLHPPLFQEGHLLSQHPFHFGEALWPSSVLADFRESRLLISKRRETHRNSSFLVCAASGLCI